HTLISASPCCANQSTAPSVVCTHSLPRRSSDLGPSGGYILSWPIAAWMIGYFVEKNLHTLKIWIVFLYNIIGGIVIVYLIGVTFLSIVGKLPWWPTAISGLAFLPGDLIKAFIAAY